MVMGGSGRPAFLASALKLLKNLGSSTCRSRVLESPCCHSSVALFDDSGLQPHALQNAVNQTSISPDSLPRSSGALAGMNLIGVAALVMSLTSPLTFGEFQGVMEPRVMQFALRLEF
jgi:hypothetical protein